MPSKSRTYSTTHPWITFDINLSQADAYTWMALGEIQSKCEHLAGAPLRPEVAHLLHLVFLAKGIMATTAIEGNTLSEKEVEQRIKGDLQLPPSKEYLGREVDNVLRAANSILPDAVNGAQGALSTADIKNYNREILRGLDVEEPTVPGEIREHRVEVGRYRGAPPEDCEYLLDRMCTWLASETFKPQPGYEIVFGVLKAIVAHLYIAWIHPFGDGNGRTARLVEVRLLLEAGAPSPAAHLLSNHYNETRAEYYRQLDRASRSGGDIRPFIRYAAEGFCHQLREQITIVRGEQVKVTWENFVHTQFKGKKSPADYRRRHLVLAISEHDEPVSIANLRRLDGEVAELYAGKTSRTVMRDLNELEQMGLVVRSGRGVRAAVVERISAFMPPRKLPNAPPEQAAQIGRQADEKSARASGGATPTGGRNR